MLQIVFIDYKCHEGYFRCKSGRCIPEARHCDSYPDCPDGDDEKNCSAGNYFYVQML